MSVAAIAVIVEGRGEVASVPILLRRIAAQIAPDTSLNIPHPIRVPRDRIVRPEQLERYLSIAIRVGGPDAAILVLLDADRDCPAELGPELLTRARQARPDKRIELVLAKSEYEAWFLAASKSVVAGAPPTPSDAEAVRGAKEWIRQHQAYRPTVDQAPMTANFDMDEARRKAPSFDKLWRAVKALLEV